jgi:hypothetical protein
MLCMENKTCANGGLKSNDNYIITFNFITSYFRLLFWIFSKDEILLVAFEHNKILWFIFISIANDRILYVQIIIPYFLQRVQRYGRTKKSFT